MGSQRSPAGAAIARAITIEHSRRDPPGSVEAGDMVDRVTVVPYDAQWPELFSRIGRVLRQALGETARRIDHIGSTAIPGLDAKPILDIQISVAAFEPADPYRAPLEAR